VGTGYDSATGQSTDFPSGQTEYIVFSTYSTTATSDAQVSMLRSGTAAHGAAGWSSVRRRRRYR
jgi:hypothetical protein